MTEVQQKFSSNFKRTLFKVNENTFDEVALSLFNHQVKHTLVYKRFVEALGIDIDKVSEIKQIPFMPISFFKNHEVLTEGSTIEKTFQSSGTTGKTTSKHHFTDVAFYVQNTLNIFESYYGGVAEYKIIALLPSYIERGNSSLLAMCDAFIKKSKFAGSGFYLDDFKQIIKELDEARERQTKVLFIGVTFAMLDFAEKHDVQLSEGVVVMETGGMKGRREELTRHEVHQVLQRAFGVSSIHSEYGMTELSSQLYSKGNGVFQSPPWVKTMLRDINDPLSCSSEIVSGPINIIDLANVDSCAFLATDDLGKYTPNGALQIMGRVDNSDMRGCNLLVL
ncbi:acyl transferase [Cyclobacteriaceae bacterium]|nr:acyl transferase [Cyclobacteriaceae bacterium]